MKTTFKFLTTLIFLCVATVSYSGSLSMNGIASFEKLRKEYYIAALYLEEPSNFPDYVLAMPGKKVMDIRITVDSWPTRSFNSIWTEAILINNDEAVQTSNKDVIMAFGELLKGDLKRGDQLSIVFTPKVGSSITLNNTVLMTTADDSLFNLLINTWIGPRPYSSDFKRNLLNLNTDAKTTELAQRHKSITPSKKRISEVSAWAPKKDEPIEVAAETTKPAAATVAETKPAPTKPAPTKPVSAPAVAAKPAEPVKPVTTPVAVTKPASAPTAAIKPAPVAVPVAAATNTADDLLKSYRANILKLTYRNTKYPERSINLKQEGVIVFKLKINRAGKVLNITEEQTSEFTSLNKAAEVAIKRSQPYPAAPDGLTGDSFDISVPFNFKL